MIANTGHKTFDRLANGPRGYVAYMIRRGDTFTRSHALSKIINVENRTDLQTISARINSGA